MRNLLQSIVLMLAGVGVYFVIQILFFPQPDQQVANVADLTRELSDIKQVIARFTEEPDRPAPSNTAPEETVLLRPNAPQTEAFALLTPPTSAKPKARPPLTQAKAAKTKNPATTNPFDENLSKAQLLAAIVRAVKAQSDDSIAAPITPQGVGVEVHVTQSSGDSVSHYFYTIQKGDSLRSIARNFYGDPTQFSRIYEANKRLLPNANHIQVGQRLRIPPKG